MESLLSKLQPIADSHGATLIQVVIAWTIAQPGVTFALCGARNPGQARENAAGGDVELSREELSVIDRALEALGPAIV